MAEVNELGKRLALSIPASPGAGVPMGDPFDVEDWDGIVIQSDVIARGSTAAVLRWGVRTCIDAFDQPSWATAAAYTAFMGSTNSSNVLVLGTASRLRRHAQILVRSTSGAVTISARARVLKKSRST